MKVLSFTILRVSFSFFLLILIDSFSESAGSESVSSHHLSVKRYTKAQNSDVIKPDLRLLHYNKEESSSIIKWRMGSLNEKEAATRDQQNPVPVPSFAPANTSTVQPAPVQRWQSLLPFFGAGAEKRGYKLPYAIGVAPGFYYGRRHIQVSNANVSIAGSTISAAGLTKIKVKSREKNWSVRLDAWIFPFLSVYALGGYTRQYTEADISVGLFDRTRNRHGVRSVDFRLPVHLTGVTYGGGITLVGGYKNYFAAFDSNYTISALRGDLIFGNRLSPDVRARICSVRLGWRKQLGDSRLNVWIGETYWDTTNTIRGTPDIPVLGTVGFSLKESTIKPWSTHIGAHLEITKTFQLMVDMGTNFSGLFCIAPVCIWRF